MLSTGRVLMSRAEGPDAFLYQALAFKPPETETDTGSCAKVRPGRWRLKLQLSVAEKGKRWKTPRDRHREGKI